MLLDGRSTADAGFQILNGDLGINFSVQWAICLRSIQAVAALLGIYILHGHLMCSADSIPPNRQTERPGRRVLSETPTP